MNHIKKFLYNIAPALTLMIMAPLLAEVLPGATRFSSLFVLPIEIFVWGGGALLIRYAVRRWELGWVNMLFLALALATAEECLIQQSSLAPLVIQLKGVVYARALGINYVYLLWALAYESVFVVFMPIYLVEHIFAQRRNDLWVNKAGVIVTILFFFIGCGLAWFTWTQIARVKVFHMAAYTPPFLTILFAIIIIGLLIFAALGPFRKKLEIKSVPMVPPRLGIIGGLGALWAMLWYGLILLAFGISPFFPPIVAIIAGILITAGILILLPRLVAHPGWNRIHNYILIVGTMSGSMLVSFIGFIGPMNLDLYFKIFINMIAVILLIRLGFKIRRQSLNT